MADDLYVLNEGENIPTDFTVAPSAGTFNIKTSVNPRAVSINVSSSTTLGINCYEIHSDDTSTMGSGTVTSSKLNRLFPVSTTVADYADNIIENAGFRVTIDTGNSSGLTLDTTRDYFVVVYADNVKKHHVAKITEQTQYDGNSYHFEFSPRLKENITVGTKVTIYQGPLKTDNVVAVGYGLLNDTATSEERHDKYVDISRPTFYFYEGDKLDHDRKYTLLKVSTNFSGTKKSVFKTAPLSSDMIIDKSFFTHHGDLTDNNKANDNLPLPDPSSDTPREINAYNSQGSTYTFDRTTWAGSSKNIYDSDGGLSTYITFIDSPVKNQIHSSPYYVNVNKTVTNKGNMATVKFFDVEKILDKKINTYERFKVKQFITEKKLDRIASSALPGTCTNTTSTTFTVSGLVAGEDWRKVLYDGSSAYEPVFIENYYYVISGITAPVDGEQVVTVTHKRLLTANAFSSVGTLETFSAKKAYRKTWSPVSQTFLADHQIDTQIDFSDVIKRNGITVTASDSDVNGIEYILEDSKDSVVLEVDKGDKDTGYTKINSRPASNFFSGKYLTDSITGKLIVNNPIFDGFVETKKADVKQAFKYEIVGRDSISKLLNTSLDKNYVHSDEFVYTTFNPLVGDPTSSTELELTALIVSSISGKVITTSGDPTADSYNLKYGDTIAFKLNDDRYVVLGVIESVSNNPSNTITLMKDCYISDLTNKGTTTTNSQKIAKLKKSIIPHKNLETTPRITNRATSIAGTLDKGIVFGSGKQFDVTGDTNLLSLGKGTGIENGYDINTFVTPVVDSDGNYLDFPIGFETSLNIPASTPEFKILSTENNPNGTVSYELGYVSPIVLGMVTRNNNDYFINTGANILNQPIRLINGQGLPDGGFLHLLSSYKNSDNSPKTFNNSFSDDPNLGLSVKSQYGFRYTQPIFRYANMHKSIGQLLLQPYSNKYSSGTTNRFNSSEVTDTLYSRNDYYEKTRNFNYYMSTYKINKKPIDYDKDNSSIWLKGYPKEQVGLYPALGSRFFDIDRVPTWYYNSGEFFGNKFPLTEARDTLSKFVGKLELHDPSALSLHLFSLGDVYPESKTNQNNIFYSGRNLDDYSIIFKRNKSENNENSNPGYDNFRDLTSPLAVNISSRKDGDYHVEPIASSNGDKKRFNLMRLTDVTFDMLFNEVDYENYEVGNNSTELSKTATKGTNAGTVPCVLVKSFPQAGLHNVDVKVTSTTVSATQLTVTSTDWFWTNPISSSSPYKYWIYYYAGSNTYPTFVGEVSTASSGVITFTGSIDQAVDVVDTILYVQVHHNNLTDSSNTTKMLLTKDSVVPYYPEDTTNIKHNYNQTAIFGNSNMQLNNKSTADDTFNTTESYPTTKGRILRTPIFKSMIGDTELVHTRKATTLATPAEASHFRMKVNANVGGNSIVLTDSNSRLRDFFDTHIQTVIGINADNSVHTWFDMIGTGSSTMTASDNNLMTISAGTSSDIHCGTKIDFIGTTYTIIKHVSGTSFRVSPNHNSTNSDSTVELVEAKYSATGGNSFFLQIGNLTTDIYDNRLYKVTNVTDTVITLTDMAGGNPSMTTQNGVDITLFSFYARTSSLAGIGSGTLSDYNNQWVESINGVDEPAVFSAFANNIIPHRAFQDSEDKIDYSGLDTIVAQFHDIPQIAENEGYAILSQDVKNIRGAHSGDALDTATLLEVDYRLGNHSTNTQRWNKAVFIQNEGTSNKGILSENYSFGMNQFPEKIYGGEVFFKPYITYTTGMNASDSTDSLISNQLTLKFDIADTWGIGTNTWINYCNNLTGYYFYNETDDKLHKIISHEINRNESNVFRHLIRIDNTSGLGGNEFLRLMRINQVCMYDFSPNVFTLNEPRIEYTKVCGKDEMHKSNFDATRYSSFDGGSGELRGQGLTFDVTEEGVKSMYVLIDPDGNISSDYLETRNSTDADYSELTASPIRMNATDGITSYVTSVSKRGDRTIEIGETKKLLGTPSFGSTFTVTVNNSPNFRPETACIGASFKVVDEIETVINNAFIINDISYTQDTEDDKYYGAFNFTGQSLYSAANNLLSYKNKEILVDGEEIKIVDKEDSKKYRNIVLSSKNSDFQITSISNDVSLLDNFDEVIVIGDGVRGVARNPISTTDTNRTVKTKEIYDYSILDQRQADLKAIQYLDVFNTANTSIEIEVADNVPFLKPGHIIELEFEEQNIPRGDYLVIETEKEFGRPTKFILSEYSKDLAGTFSLLLGEIRNLQGFTKQKVYTSTTIPRIKRGKVNIKFVKSTATLTSGITTTSTIGFGYTIGFDSEVGV